uniref:COG complex component COG2 C-terminal domain-containing protein n=1 Tax=Strigamia maritima TaxID=126957 RepID=T1JGE2_STRMM
MKSVTVSAVVLLIADIRVLVPKLSVFCDDAVLPQLTNLGFNDVDILKESMGEFEEVLSQQVPCLTGYVTKDISLQCGNHLKLVSDIPRLYRRTNKDAPSKPSSYVCSILSPLESFFKEQEDVIEVEMKEKWGSLVLAEVTQQYYNATSNVLTSVKKMEESLSRLKKAREKGSSSAIGSAIGMSDDDKIRLQLAFDVQEYGAIINTLNFDKSIVAHYQDLIEMVESARTTPPKPN